MAQTEVARPTSVQDHVRKEVGRDVTTGPAGYKATFA